MPFGHGLKTLSRSYPFDRLWGVGLYINDHNAVTSSLWPDCNLFVATLQRVHQMLLLETTDASPESLLVPGPDVSRVTAKFTGT